MIQSVLGATRAEAEKALEQVLDSRVFAKAQRSRRLLRYLVEMSAADPAVTVKEYTLALDVFDRGADYDPATDATVRVEASRLRSRLREYYDEEGVTDPLMIEVPKGRYGAVLRRREMGRATDVGVSPAEPVRTGPERVAVSGRGRRSWLWWVAAIACVAAVAVVGALWLRSVRANRTAGGSGRSVTSMAILPIVNQTGDATLDGLADGMTDELIRQLSEVPALRLLAHGSVFGTKGRGRTLGWSGESWALPR